MAAFGRIDKNVAGFAWHSLSPRVTTFLRLLFVCTSDTCAQFSILSNKSQNHSEIQKLSRPHLPSLSAESFYFKMPQSKKGRSHAPLPSSLFLTYPQPSCLRNFPSFRRIAKIMTAFSQAYSLFVHNFSHPNMLPPSQRTVAMFHSDISISMRHLNCSLRITNC